MDNIILTATLSAGALALPACSSDARQAMESAAADAEVNADAVAGNISDAARKAGTAATEAKNAVEADV